MTKVCPRCRVEKSVSEYCKCSRMKDGLQPACKACMNESYNRSRSKKKQHYYEVSQTRLHAQVKRMQEWKSERGCCICNEKYYCCLELHHLDPETKEGNPTDIARVSWSAFLAEAEKCVVLCANCHRKVHGGVLKLPLIE